MISLPQRITRRLSFALRCLAPACALAFVLLSTPAHADTATATRFFDDTARRAFARRDYREALRYFLLVDLLTPTPGSAFNVSVAAYECRDLELTFSSLERYLASHDDDAERKAQAARRMTELRGKLALVRVDTEPPGARVFVDKRELGAYGASPVTVVVEPGAHQVLTEMPGFANGSSAVEAKKGEEATASIALQALTGTLDAATTPRAAAFTATRDDGLVVKGVGDKPLELPVGSYVVRAEPDGYRPVEARVVIPRGQTVRLALAARPLPPKTGRLLVASGSVPAQVFVDGKPTATTPATLDSIPIGTHRVEVRARGFRTWSGSVSVSETETAFVEASLVPAAK